MSEKQEQPAAKPPLTDAQKAAIVLRSCLGLARLEAEARVQAMNDAERKTLVEVHRDLDQPNQAHRVHAAIDKHLDRKRAEAKAGQSQSDGGPPPIS